MESVLVRRDMVACVASSLWGGGGGDVWVSFRAAVRVVWLAGQWATGDILCRLFFLFCRKEGLWWSAKEVEDRG